ncbi:MAG: hypothetical protein ACRDQU_18910 [Pseudonocardiaceae bacterium]
MSRSTTERQTVQVTQEAGDTDAELTKAVDFATLISMSSLNAPDVQKDRLTGRKEIAARLAEQAETFGPETSLATSTAAARDVDPTFECHVADQLEIRGHTFEAELRYRRLRGHPAVTNRLALLLDAKGFHREAWQWYLRAARSNDINSLFRLAIICWSRGDRGWAMRLTKHAIAQLEPAAYDELTRSINTLVRHRTSGSNMSVTAVLNSQATTDAVYTLGSVLLILASRPDLARLAYCSALARGHSLAAISMLDLTRASIAKKPDNWRLGNMLKEGLDGGFEKYSPIEYQRDSLDRSLLLLKSDVQNEKFEGLMQAIHAPTGRREDAIERILFTAQLLTILHGYGRVGCYTRMLPCIDAAADTVCRKVHNRLVTGKVGDAASIINMIRRWSAQELSNYKRSEQQESDSLRRKKRTPGEHKKEVVASSTIRRIGKEYFDLPSAHREVLVLQLAGLYSDEVANALDYREGDTDQIFADAVARLQEAQQGEQIPTGKLLGAEVDNCFSSDILDLIISLPAWSDTGSRSWPKLSPNPTQLLRRQRARTGRP